MSETLKTYKCKSRVMYGSAGNDKNECRYSCQVYTEFEPRGCLFNGGFQRWEEDKGVVLTCNHPEVARHKLNDGRYKCLICDDVIIIK